MALKILFFTKQPVMALGLRFSLSGLADVTAVHSLPNLLKTYPDEQDITILDMSSEITLNDIARISGDRAVILLVDSCHGSFAYQAINLGVKGIFRKALPVLQLQRCLNEVKAGKAWFEPELMQEIAQGRRTLLAPRERDFAVLAAQGFSNKAMAEKLGLAEGTVKVYMCRIFYKLGVKNRYELAAWVLRNMRASQEGSTSLPLPLNQNVLKQFMQVPGVPQMEMAEV